MKVVTVVTVDMVLTVVTVLIVVTVVKEEEQIGMKKNNIGMTIFFLRFVAVRLECKLIFNPKFLLKVETSFVFM